MDTEADSEIRTRAAAMARRYTAICTMPADEVKEVPVSVTSILFFVPLVFKSCWHKRESLTGTVVAHETRTMRGMVTAPAERPHPLLSYPVNSGITPVEIGCSGVEPDSPALQAGAE